MPKYTDDLFSITAKSTVNLSFHQSMIADRRRLRTFCDGVRQAVQAGDVMMDIGVGTGVLTLAAIQAGARRVICVDDDDIILHARETFKRNGCARKTRLVRGNILNIKFSGPEPDLVVSELLGSFALAENITEIAYHVREQFPSLTRFVPEWFELFVVPVEHNALNAAIREFDKPCEGMDLTHLTGPALNNVYAHNMTPRHHLGDPEILAHVDLLDIDDPDMNVLTTCDITRAGTLHGFSGWFRSKVYGDAMMETGPFFPRVHWEDVFFPIETPLEVRPGDVVSFRLIALCHGSGDVWAWTIEVQRRGKIVARSRLNSDYRLPRGRVLERTRVKLA